MHHYTMLYTEDDERKGTFSTFGYCAFCCSCIDVPIRSQLSIFSKISAIIIPTNKPLLIKGRMKAGIDSKYVAGNVIIIVPTNNGIAERYTFNVLNEMLLKNSIDELNSCK